MKAVIVAWDGWIDRRIDIYPKETYDDDDGDDVMMVMLLLMMIIMVMMR